VGGGVAGAKAAGTLLEEGHEGRSVLVGDVPTSARRSRRTICPPPPVGRSLDTLRPAETCHLDIARCRAGILKPHTAGSPGRQRAAVRPPCGAPKWVPAIATDRRDRTGRSPSTVGRRSTAARSVDRHRPRCSELFHAARDVVERRRLAQLAKAGARACGHRGRRSWSSLRSAAFIRVAWGSGEEGTAESPKPALEMPSRRADSNRGPLHYEDAAAFGAGCGPWRRPPRTGQFRPFRPLTFCGWCRVVCCPPVATRSLADRKRMRPVQLPVRRGDPSTLAMRQMLPTLSITPRASC
jgi:hypothetical protein